MAEVRWPEVYAGPRWLVVAGDELRVGQRRLASAQLGDGLATVR
jgi:hypothetical protein